MLSATTPRPRRVGGCRRRHPAHDRRALHGAKGVGAAALFRLAWDFVGSGLAGRNQLYERFYLTSASRNRITAHLTNTDRSRPSALVDGILAAGRAPATG
jgi:aromatic ring hydroxylase